MGSVLGAGHSGYENASPFDLRPGSDRPLTDWCLLRAVFLNFAGLKLEQPAT